MSEHQRGYAPGAGIAVNPVDDGVTPTPPSRADRASWRRRLITWPAAILMIIATVVVGRLIQLGTPIGDDYNRPFIHSGQMGEPVDGGSYVVTVESIRGGRALEQTFGTATTDGIFLLVKVRLSAYDEDVKVAYQAVVDRHGFIYATVDRSFNYLEQRRLQPRIPIAAEILFEVPTTAAVEGLTLRLSTYPWDTNSHQVVTEVPLTITEDQVSEWYRTTEPIKQMQPEVTT